MKDNGTLGVSRSRMIQQCGDSMDQRSVILGAYLLIIAGALSGCELRQEHNIQYFEAGGATCLSGKQLYFGSPFLVEKSAPFGHYSRFVSEKTTLSVDPAGHETIDFSQADPFELALPDFVRFGYYRQWFDTLFIGSDGTIAFGSPGTGNNNLVDALSSEQICILPVDATAAEATVRYNVNEEAIVITYENIGGNTFQCELFLHREQRNEIAITYPVVSENTRAGVVGIPDPLLTPDRLDELRESVLCENSPLNPLAPPS